MIKQRNTQTKQADHMETVRLPTSHVYLLRALLSVMDVLIQSDKE